MKDIERNWQLWVEVGMGENNVDFFFSMWGHMFRGVMNLFIVK